MFYSWYSLVVTTAAIHTDKTCSKNNRSPTGVSIVVSHNNGTCQLSYMRFTSFGIK